MSTFIKTVSSLLGALGLGLVLAASPALAASTVSYTGQEGGFTFADGTAYHETDLFPSLKGVMPGDSLNEQVEFVNASDETDFVSLYLRAEVHDDASNPIASEQVAAAETVASMEDFLAQLTLTVSLADGTQLYSGPAHMAGLEQSVPLGDVRSGESLELLVQLDVPTDLGYDYANRLGEVDWVFVVEAKDDPVSLCVTKVWDDGGSSDRPASVTVELRNAGKPVERVELSAANAWTHTWEGLDFEGAWGVVEVDVPAGYSPAYSVRGEWVTITNSAKLIQTGQLRWPVPVLACCGVAAAACGLWLALGGRRRRERAGE